MGNTALKFKIGDKVKYTGCYKHIWGVGGVVVAKCGINPNLCRIIRFTDNYERHVYTKDLVINKPKQQLLFNFME